MVRISLTEEMILNYSALPKEFDGWRRYRIEYYSDGPYDFHEETIYVPPMFDINKFEDYFDRMVRKAQT